MRSVIGISRLGKFINDYLRNKLHVENLRLLANTERTGENTFVERMTENKIPIQIMDYQLPGGGVIG